MSLVLLLQKLEHKNMQLTTEEKLVLIAELQRFTKLLHDKVFIQE